MKTMTYYKPWSAITAHRPFQTARQTDILTASCLSWWSWSCYLHLPSDLADETAGPPTSGSLHHAQYVNKEQIKQMISVGDLVLFPSKQMAFFVFQMAQQIAAKPTSYTCLPFGKLHLILSQYWVKEAGLTDTPKVKANAPHIFTDWTFKKEMRCRLSGGRRHKKHPLHFPFMRLSLVQNWVL